MGRDNNNNEEIHGPDSSHDDSLAAFDAREEDIESTIQTDDSDSSHDESLAAFDAREETIEDDLVELPQHVIAARTKSNSIRMPEIWPEILDIEQITSRKSDVDLCNSTRGDLLTELSKDFAQSIQFPKSTTWLHGLGCIASAMTKDFTFTYYGNGKPVNLYIITAQPPSTGKSAVNDLFTGPIIDAYRVLNEENKPIRMRIIRKISSLEKQLNTTKKLDPHEEQELIDQLCAEEIKLEACPEWNPILDDVTIEAAENIAKSQKGMFNIISAEAEAINVIAGGVYGDGDGGKKGNFGLILKAWDGERNSSARIGREGYTGTVKATICVIAQDDSVDTILSKGANGRGVAERFLLLSEKPLLGERNFDRPRDINQGLYGKYKRLIVSIINEPPVRLIFSSEALAVINDYKASQEPELRDDGKYSHNLLTGFIGKCDKQIMKIASILHVINYWQDGGDHSKMITDDYAIWAITVFDELAKTYINAADVMGYVGSQAELIKLAYIFQSRVEKKKFKITVPQLRNIIKGTTPFKGSRSLTKKLRLDLLPKLEENGYCTVARNIIHLNPKL